MVSQNERWNRFWESAQARRLEETIQDAVAGDTVLGSFIMNVLFVATEDGPNIGRCYDTLDRMSDVLLQVCLEMKEK